MSGSIFRLRIRPSLFDEMVETEAEVDYHVKLE
jgi:hypothetical protein